MPKVAKEKALQLERKRKAAQFLAQLAEKKTTVSSVTAVSEDRAGDSSAEEGELPSAAAGDCSSHVSVRPVQRSAARHHNISTMITRSSLRSGDRRTPCSVL